MADTPCLFFFRLRLLPWSDAVIYWASYHLCGLWIGRSVDATALKIFARDPTMHGSVGFIFFLLPSSMPMLARLEVLTNLLTLD